MNFGGNMQFLNCGIVKVFGGVSLAAHNMAEEATIAQNRWQGLEYGTSERNKYVQQWEDFIHAYMKDAELEKKTWETPEFAAWARSRHIDQYLNQYPVQFAALYEYYCNKPYDGPPRFNVLTPLEVNDVFR